MKYSRIIFWQDSTSPHQAPWIRELAEVFEEGQVIGCFSRGLSSNRIAMGWKIPNYGKTRIMISPDSHTIEKLLNNNSEYTVNIFSGFVQNKNIRNILKNAISTKAKIGILSEGRDWRGIKGLLRKTHSLICETRHRKAVDFVLAIGHLSRRWFIRCGYNKEKLFPFCYVVEENCCDNHIIDKRKKYVTITAIGQLIPRKCFDLLLKALTKVSNEDWILKIIGDGVERLNLEELADNYGLSSKIEITGILENKKVLEKLRRTDIFTLPSRWDGWGAVVNEALMSGVPVICSDFCGAADLVKHSGYGEIFRSGSVNDLCNVLNRWIDYGVLNAEKRKEISNWARCVYSVTISRYFLDILDHIFFSSKRPVPPWQKI